MFIFAKVQIQTFGTWQTLVNRFCLPKYKVGPVINGVTAPISRVISPQLPIYFRPFMGPFIWVMSLHLERSARAPEHRVPWGLKDLYSQTPKGWRQGFS